MERLFGWLKVISETAFAFQYVFEKTNQKVENNWNEHTLHTMNLSIKYKSSSN